MMFVHLSFYFIFILFSCKTLSCLHQSGCSCFHHGILHTDCMHEPRVPGEQEHRLSGHAELD